MLNLGLKFGLDQGKLAQFALREGLLDPVSLCAVRLLRHGQDRVVARIVVEGSAASTAWVTDLYPRRGTT